MQPSAIRRCPEVYDTIIVQQLIFPPYAAVGNLTEITCLDSLFLTNQSTTGIPSPFTATAAVIVSSWNDPSGTSGNEETFRAQIPGQYSLTVKDMNNGCISTTTVFVGDSRNFPQINLIPVYDLCFVPQTTIFPTVSNPEPEYIFSWTLPANVSSNPYYQQNLIVNSVGIYTFNVLYGSCVSSATVEVMKCVNVASIKMNLVHHYPNPVTDVLHLSDPELRLRLYRIYDSLGTLLLEDSCGTELKMINFSNIKNGLYVLEIIDKYGGSETWKLIKN
jgi:hypothetical protein